MSSSYVESCSKIRAGICFLFLAMITACSTTHLPVLNKTNQKPINYTIVYLIHGDANYLYHTPQGQPRQADKKVLREAKWLGEHAENGEVFIYHLKQETKILFFFPRKDRTFLYYRNGELVYEKKYSPDSKKQVFNLETKLYHYFHQPMTADSSFKKVLLYFGHEVPVKTGTHYFRSRPDALFSTALFAEGVSRFIEPGAAKFDLTVLSTCDNGTPLMVHALAPFTNYILASPLNLHLSHIYTKKMHLLEEPGEISTEKLAVEMADDTYSRLSGFLQTVISFSLYNVNKVEAYLPEMATCYKGYLERQDDLTPSAENVDCSNLPFFNPKKARKGVRVWYKPPQFGREAGDKYFSGWGCKL